MSAVEKYISEFPEELQERLIQMRNTILQIAPDAEEGISYGMPAYKLSGKPLVYFAGFRNHVGFYATPSGHKAFAEELANYKTGKGSVQFPHSSPLPLNLVARITRFRADENCHKVNSK